VTGAAPTQPDTDRDELPAGLIGAALAVTAWGAGSVITKGIDMGGLAVAVYRFWLYSALLLVWMRARGTPFRFRVLRQSMWGGIALGIDVALFFSAVKLTNVVNATLLGSLQPLVVGVVAARFFGERIRPRDAAWSLVALVGVVGVVVASNGTPAWSARGDLLAAGAMLAWSAYFIASRESRRRLTSTEFTAGTALWAAAINTPLAVAFGQDLSLPEPETLGLLVAMTVLAGLVGHSLMNWSLVRIPLWIGSTFTLLIPVTSSLLAWVFLDEALNGAQAGAMALVLISLAAIVRGQASASRPVVEAAAVESVATPTAEVAPVVAQAGRWSLARPLRSRRTP
jgi:drug/metabolite transporter (DMT)-like permease